MEHSSNDMMDLEGIDLEASVLCPHCGEVVLAVDEDGDFDGDLVSPCEHLVYLWIDSGGGFELVSQELQDWLASQKKADDSFNEYDVISNAEKNPFVDTVIEHEVGIAAYYGFKKSAET